MTLQEQLDRRRRELGMTQSELGEKAGTGRSGVSKILGGKRDVLVTTLERLADALGLEVVLCPKGSGAGYAVAIQDGAEWVSALHEAKGRTVGPWEPVKKDGRP